MPIIFWKLIIAIVPLAIKLIDKFVPDKMTRQRDFHSKKKVMGKMQDWHDLTIAEIAEKGKEKI